VIQIWWLAGAPLPAIKQHDQSSHKMDSVRAGEDVNSERLGFEARKAHLRAKDIPYQNLSARSKSPEKTWMLSARQVAPEPRGMMPMAANSSSVIMSGAPAQA